MTSASLSTQRIAPPVEHSLLSQCTTSTSKSWEEETPAKDCAWPLFPVQKNTLGRKGRNKIAVGQIFGRLQVVKEYEERAPNTERRWLCVCSCGREAVITGGSLNAGVTRSCGCLRREKFLGRVTKHGKRFTPTYAVWLQMLGRCQNPRNRAYARYGGRGIEVAKRWKNYLLFLEDMGECPPGLTLERINNDHGYAPGNCVWASRTVQAHNKSNNKVTWEIVAAMRESTKTHREVAEEHRLSRSFVMQIRNNKAWIDCDYTPNKEARQDGRRAKPETHR